MKVSFQLRIAISHEFIVVFLGLCVRSAVFCTLYCNSIGPSFIRYACARYNLIMPISNVSQFGKIFLVIIEIVLVRKRKCPLPYVKDIVDNTKQTPLFVIHFTYYFTIYIMSRDRRMVEFRLKLSNF